MPARLPRSPLVVAFTRLRGAPPGPARAHAQGEVYLLAHPLLAKRCAPMLLGRAVEGHLTPADLASAALSSAVIVHHPTRCRHTSEVGILRYLTTVARRHLLDSSARSVDATAAPADARVDLRAVDVTVPIAPAEGHVDSTWESEVWAAYERALTGVDATRAAIWRAVVEQELPVGEVGRTFGVHRTTVFRIVQEVAAHLASHLAPFATNRRLLTPRALIAVRPPRQATTTQPQGTVRHRPSR